MQIISISGVSNSFSLKDMNILLPFKGPVVIIFEILCLIQQNVEGFFAAADHCWQTELKVVFSAHKLSLNPLFSKHWKKSMCTTD